MFFLMHKNDYCGEFHQAFKNEFETDEKGNYCEACQVCSLWIR